jgi:ABC transporter transmembrane region
MASFYVLTRLIQQNRRGLSVTYGLIILESTIALSRPYFLGLATSDLLSQRFDGLLYLMGLQCALIVVGYVRRRYDTRVFTNVYVRLVLEMFQKRLSIKDDDSKLFALTSLCYEFTDFLENKLTYYIESLYGVIGALLMLYFLDNQLIWLCIGLFILSIIPNIGYGKKMNELNFLKNNDFEKQYAIISQKDYQEIEHHFYKLRLWLIKISDFGALNYGGMELLATIGIGIALYLISQNGTSIKEIIAVNGYIIQFSTGIIMIPNIVDRLSSLKDISLRVKAILSE